MSSKSKRRYGYSYVGTPAVLEKKQLLGNNLTLTGTISINGPEFFLFTFKGGTKNEHFSHYFNNMVVHLKLKYPMLKLIFVMDNLWAHKCL